MEEILMISKEHVRVGFNILVRRRELHMTQKDVANLSNVSVAKISAIEHGKSDFPLQSLMRIGQALEIDYRDLLK